MIIMILCIDCKSIGKKKVILIQISRPKRNRNKWIRERNRRIESIKDIQ